MTIYPPGIAGDKETAGERTGISVRSGDDFDFQIVPGVPDLNVAHLYPRLGIDISGWEKTV